MNTAINLSDEELQIISRIKEIYGDESFEISEMVYLLLACNLLAATKTYADYELTSKTRGLIEIIADKIPDFKRSKFKLAFPETEGLLNLLERRISYQEII